MVEELINNQFVQFLALILSIFPLFLGCKKMILVVIKWISKRKYIKEKEEREKYYTILNSIEFQNWRDKVLLMIYGDKYFTKVFNVDFPAFVIEFEKYYRYDEFNKLYNKNELRFENKLISNINNEIDVPDINDVSIVNDGSLKEQNKKKKLISDYKRILGKSVKYPKLIGFMLDHYDLNENKKITHIYSKIGNYELNVFSSHILEYELLCAFKKIGDKKIDECDLWHYLPFRKYIHNSNLRECALEDVLYSGVGRYSLFSVQCFVMFKDKNKKKYVTILMRRAIDPDKIAAKIGFYQFPPAGGFELYEKEQIHTADVVMENYSLRKAVFREYLEEVFGIDDFKTVNPETNQETTNNILYHEEIRDLISMIENGTARFELLGVAVDLVSLRHELSFILVIDDESYSAQKHFCPNDEFTRNQSVASKIRIPISEIEDLLYNKPNINQGSAMLYYMVKRWCKQNNVNIES